MVDLFKRSLLYLSEKGYFKFFAVGVSGVTLQLFVTWVFTHFVFGIERYFIGYLIGLGATLIFNFLSHTFFTFKTETSHGKRFVGFFVHFVIMIFVQASLVKWLTPVFGIHYYLVVIAAIIFTLSNLNFLLFKFVIFRISSRLGLGVDAS